jgi:hypothetical protein
MMLLANVFIVYHVSSDEPRSISTRKVLSQYVSLIEIEIYSIKLSYNLLLLRPGAPPVPRRTSPSMELRFVF